MTMPITRALTDAMICHLRLENESWVLFLVRVATLYGWKQYFQSWTHGDGYVFPRSWKYFPWWRKVSLAIWKKHTKGVRARRCRYMLGHIWWAPRSTVWMGSVIQISTQPEVCKDSRDIWISRSCVSGTCGERAFRFASQIWPWHIEVVSVRFDPSSGLASPYWKPFWLFLVIVTVPSTTIDAY